MYGLAVVEGEGVEGREAVEREPLDGARLVVGLPDPIDRRQDEVEGDVLAILVGPIGARVDAKEPLDAPVPPGLLAELSPDSLDQVLVPVEESPRADPTCRPR